MSGKVAEFAKYDVKLKNDLWSWSGRTPDNEVVVTLWDDEFDRDANPVTYTDFTSPTVEQWRNRLGNRFRMKDLKYALDHRGGRFRVVILTPVDLTSEPRKIKEALAHPEMIMRITEFSQTTGQFRAVQVDQL